MAVMLKIGTPLQRNYRFGAVNPSVQGRRLAECAIAVEDEVFEEEESEEVLCDPARPCHPDYVRGRRTQPAERGPGGGLTATYCTQLCMTKNNATPPTRNVPFHVEDGASWSLLGVS